MALYVCVRCSDEFTCETCLIVKDAHPPWPLCADCYYNDREALIRYLESAGRSYNSAVAEGRKIMTKENDHPRKLSAADTIPDDPSMILRFPRVFLTFNCNYNPMGAAPTLGRIVLIDPATYIVETLVRRDAMGVELWMAVDHAAVWKHATDALLKLFQVVGE